MSNDKVTASQTTRREFLKGAAATTGALVIGCALPVASRHGQAVAAASLPAIPKLA